MYSILVAIYLLSVVLILKNKGEKRLMFFTLGLFMVPGNINLINNSMFMGYMLYATAFIASMAIHGEFKIKNMANCPVWTPLIILLASCILIGLFDERLGPSTGIWRGIQYFIGKILPFIFGWVSLGNKEKYTINDNYNTTKSAAYYNILPFTLIITLFGLMTAVTKTNPILDAVGLEDRFLFEYDDSFRSFRVTGANISSSVYGLSCAILFLCGMFLNKKKNNITYFALGMLFINIFLSATRAAMIPFIVALIYFMIKRKGIAKSLKYISVTVICMFILSPILPAAVTDYSTQLVESIADVVLPSGTGGEKFVGSSVDAREMQIAASMTYLEKKPLFGHGIGYSTDVLLKDGKHDDLLGMESYLCFIGIELGLVHGLALIIFFVACFIYFIKNKKYAPDFADMGSTFVVMYVLFLIYAWVGTAWFFYMPALGYLMKKVYLAKKKTLDGFEQN